MMPHVRYLAALAALLLCFNVTAQQKFEPQVGQAGKDVIWVTTPDDVVDRMLTMAQVAPSDFGGRHTDGVLAGLADLRLEFLLCRDVEAEEQRRERGQKTDVGHHQGLSGKRRAEE